MNSIGAAQSGAHAAVAGPAADATVAAPSLEQMLDAWVDGPIAEPAPEAAFGAEAPQEDRAGLKIRVMEWQRRFDGRPPLLTEPLDLSGLHLRSLPAGLGMLKNLGALNLSNNALTELPTGIGRELPNLAELNLSHNRLEQLPPSLSRLNLSSLNLDANQFRELPAVVGRLWRLTSLTARGNHMVSLPENISDMQCLMCLDVHGNELAELPAGLWQLPELKILNLQGNRLAQFPLPEGKLLTLHKLVLDDNPALNGLTDDVMALALTCEVTTHGCGLDSVTSTVLARARSLQNTGQVLALRDALVAEAAAQAAAAAIDLEDEDDLHAERAQRGGEPFFVRAADRPALATHEGETIDHADSFFQWLDKVPETSDYKNTEMRPALVTRLGELIDGLRADVELRKTCFDLARDFMATCGDAVSLGLNAMHAALQEAAVVKPGVTEKDAIELGQKMFVLKLVNAQGQAKIESLAQAALERGERRDNPEDVETMLCFQVELKKELARYDIHVPMATSSMLYGRYASVGREEVEAAATQVCATLQTEGTLKAFLAEWAPLEKFVEVNNQPRFENELQQFHDQMDGLLEQLENGDINEGRYKAEADKILPRIAVAKRNLAGTLVSELLAKHFQPAASTMPS